MSNFLVFPADEPKQSVKWQRLSDYMDGSPRYTFEGRDPETTYERFQVVIYAEREREIPCDPSSARRHYYGYVRDNKNECADTVGPFCTVKEAKRETLKLFNEFMVMFSPYVALRKGKLIITNLNQLKKAIQKGSKIEVIEHCRPECVGQLREVTLANTQGFYSKILNEPNNPVNQGNDGKGPVLWWSKAPFWEFDKGLCSLYSSDTRRTEGDLIMSFLVQEKEAA